MEIILIVAFIVLPAVGFALAGVLAAGKAEDAWNEGYGAGYGAGLRDGQRDLAAVTPSRVTLVGATTQDML